MGSDHPHLAFAHTPANRPAPTVILSWLQCLRCRVKLTLHNKAVANSVSGYVHLTGNVCFRIRGILPKSSNLVGSGTTPWAITCLRKGR